MASLVVWSGATPSLWLELRGKLGERHDAFFEAVARQAAKRRLAGDAAIARYAHLCCAFGPAFEERPENEWALAILADERLAEWLRLHQLVQRAARELKRRGGDADALQRADAALLDALDDERHAADADAEPLARVACDLDALELRVLDGEWRHEYRKLDGSLISLFHHKGEWRTATKGSLGSNQAKWPASDRARLSGTTTARRSAGCMSR